MVKPIWIREEASSFFFFFYNCLFVSLSGLVSETKLLRLYQSTLLSLEELSTIVYACNLISTLVLYSVRKRCHSTIAKERLPFPLVPCFYYQPLSLLLIVLENSENGINVKNGKLQLARWWF